MRSNIFSNIHGMTLFAAWADWLCWVGFGSICCLGRFYHICYIWGECLGRSTFCDILPICDILLICLTCRFAIPICRNRRLFLRRRRWRLCGPSPQLQGGPMNSGTPITMAAFGPTPRLWRYIYIYR